jgi:hypothetical protein
MPATSATSKCPFGPKNRKMRLRRVSATGAPSYQAARQAIAVTSQGAAAAI